MNKDLRKVVILLAHPNMKESQANKALIDAVTSKALLLMLTNGAKSFPMLPPSFINFPFIGWLRRHCSKNGRTKYSPSFPRLRQ